MDAALQINPYYGKTSKAGILAHFGAVLDYGGVVVEYHSHSHALTLSSRSHALTLSHSHHALTLYPTFTPQ